MSGAWLPDRGLREGCPSSPRCSMCIMTQCWRISGGGGEGRQRKCRAGRQGCGGTIRWTVGPPRTRI
eukprot:7366580-Alexandrium_andersonii.AAC.1